MMTPSFNTTSVSIYIYIHTHILGAVGRVEGDGAAGRLDGTAVADAGAGVEEGSNEAIN